MVLIQTDDLDQLVEKLAEKLAPLVSTIVSEKLSTPASSTDDRYLTRIEVCRLLRITPPTLRVYTKKGFITGHRVQRRVLYKLSEVDASLKQMNFSLKKGA